jgi:imidazolonepropionase-like amidohydrolase
MHAESRRLRTRQRWEVLESRFGGRGRSGAVGGYRVRLRWWALASRSGGGRTATAWGRARSRATRTCFKAASGGEEQRRRRRWQRTGVRKPSVSMAVSKMMGQ